MTPWRTGVLTCLAAASCTLLACASAGRGPYNAQAADQRDIRKAEETYQQALVGAGLPITAFSGVQPRADQTANGLRIQTVQLRLQGLRPADFGAWLAAWTTADQPWRLS